MKEPIDFDLLSPLQPKHLPPFVDGEGALLLDDEGHSWVDLNEMRVVLGQKNPGFARAMETAMQGYTAPKNGCSPSKKRLLEYLNTTTKGRFQGAFLASSGSEGVEWAVRLAKRMTGREEILSFSNSIHGRTYLSSSLSGLPRRKAGYGPLAPGGVILPYPNCAHCPMKREKGCCEFTCLELAQTCYASSSAQRGAAILVELCQGAGVVLPPKGYMQRLQQWAHQQGMLFIVDEIQTGMGRTGSLYMYEEEGLEPDMLLLGKALGNGQHIAALLVKERPPVEWLGALAGGSGDDPVACAAACEVYKQLEEGLLSHIQNVGDILCQGLYALSDHPLVKECRGRGLMAAMEFYRAEDCKRVWNRLAQKGYLSGCAGATLFCKPPYVVTQAQIEGFLRELEESLKMASDEAQTKAQNEAQKI